MMIHPEAPTEPSQPPAEPPAGKPVQVKWLVAVLWIQTALNALFTLLLFWGAQDLSSHGEGGAGTLAGLGVLSLVVVVLLLASAVAAMDGKRWGWMLALVMEIIAIVSGIIGVATGNPASVAGIGIAGGVISLLVRPQTKEWFGR